MAGFPRLAKNEKEFPSSIEMRISMLSFTLANNHETKMECTRNADFNRWERCFDRPLWWMLVVAIGLPVAGILLGAMTK